MLACHLWSLDKPPGDTVSNIAYNKISIKDLAIFECKLGVKLKATLLNLANLYVEYIYLCIYCVCLSRVLKILAENDSNLNMS